MIYNNKIRHFVLLCLLSLAWVGCTDWDDHYGEEGQYVVSDKTLWEEIESRIELKPFKEILEQYGYKEMLNGSQMYTVFAPVGEIDTTGIGSSEEKIKTEVLENHIARFAHSANGATNNKPAVVMLKSKPISFMQVGDGYVFGDNKLTNDYNIRTQNGVLHVIEGQQPFFHNIWEYLTTDTLFDNIRNYLYSFNDTILDEDKSVKGEINENGQQEYLDSVVYIHNSLLYSLGELNNEDSTYTMIIPTNEAWDKAYARIKPYFQYPTTLYSQYPSRVASEKRDSLCNYYTQLSIVRDLVFSHARLQSVEDSLVSTTGGVFRTPTDYILSEDCVLPGDAGHAVCSNGDVFLVNELKHNPWDSWHETITVEAERANALDYNPTASNYQYYKRTLANTDTLYTKVSNASYIEVRPVSSIAVPKVVFNVWNTLAGKYDVKVVFLPQTLVAKGGAIKPNKFTAKYQCFSPKSGSWVVDQDLLRIEGNDVIFDFVNDPHVVDTVELGTVNLGRSTFAQDILGFKLELHYPSLGTEDYSTTFLIDCVILEPSKE